MPQPEKNLALDLVRVTEAAALASARWLGRGDKNAGDQAAVDAMRLSFDTLDIQGTIIIGEGEKDEAPMLYNGESIGSGQGPAVDVAVDPVEGTKLLAYGRPNAISVVGLAPAGAMRDLGPSYYMRKLVVPAAAADVVELDAPVRENLTRIAKALDKDIDDLTVFVLDKPRHGELIKKIREAGARIQLHTDGDVMGALMAVDSHSEVDALLGVGGAPEGVLSACAIRGMGGRMLCRLAPQSESEKNAVRDHGVDLDAIYTEESLVTNENVFFAATGISSGTFFKGVRFTGAGAATQSLVIRGKTGTVRYIESHHNWDKLMRISAVPYD